MVLLTFSKQARILEKKKGKKYSVHSRMDYYTHTKNTTVLAVFVGDAIY
jgi:hypothetical protein